MDPILTRYVREPNSFTLDFYQKQGGGYGALRKALAMAPEAVVEAVKQSGLRGRGGAGFPTGMKWQFVDKKSPKPKYLCCNADESEPGTFKDHVLMERNPHLLFEGCLIGCYAIGAKVAYIYIRGEFYHVQEVLEAELAKARAANNVETLCNVPFIVERGAEWFAGIGPEKNGGPKLFCISGHVRRPGTFEASMDVTLRDLIYDDRFAGGIRGGHALKAVIPGGSSVPVLLPHEIDVPASFDGIAKAGSLLGSAGVIVMDETTCMVWAAENLLHFYKHESCGKCTPCREGCDWLFRLLHKIEMGEGQPRDLDLLLSVSNNILGKTLCAFGDAAATPVLSTIKTFREEYEAHVREGRCTVPAEWRADQAMSVAH
jgi:NADH-quinone oxidoreductase subunit F